MIACVSRNTTRSFHQYTVHTIECTHTHTHTLTCLTGFPRSFSFLSVALYLAPLSFFSISPTLRAKSLMRKQNYLQVSRASSNCSTPEMKREEDVEHLSDKVSVCVCVCVHCYCMNSVLMTKQLTCCVF